MENKEAVIGIIAAMEQEAKDIQKEIIDAKKETIAGVDFIAGMIHGIKVIVVQSGVGKVNAGVCASLLIDRFHVTALINSGIAGSLNNELNIGDVVISKDAVYHDVDATVFGYAKGEVPGMKTRVFEADKELMRKVERCIDSKLPKLHYSEGRVASGDAFISDKENKKRIKEDYQADCCEMEGAAIAQVACLYHVPYVILRFISDKADGSDLKDYMEFEQEAARNSAKILIEILKAWTS